MLAQRVAILPRNLARTFSSCPPSYSQRFLGQGRAGL
jgi:hypothetical protein